MARRVHHLVTHQDRHEGELFFHECHRVWTLSLESREDPRGITSLIITGSHPRTYYGSDDPEIVRRVDRLRRRLASGRCFLAGPLGLDSSGQRRKQHPEAESLRLLVEEIERDLLDGTVRGRACSIRLREAYRDWTDDPPAEWVISGTHRSLWERTSAAHQPEAEALDRDETLQALARELAIVSRPFESIATSAGPLRLLAQILRRRSSVGGGGSRFAYRSPRSLAGALAGALVSCSDRTIRRRAAPLPRR